MTVPERVAVVGAGTMGAPTAHLCAASGFHVMLFDLSEDALARGVRGIEESLARFVTKGTLSDADREAASARLTPTTDISEVRGAGVIVEAVVEALTVKREVWSEVSGVVDKDTLLATNTSSLSVTEIVAGVLNPERFCGLHFFNPAPMLPLVEVVQAVMTSENTATRAEAFVARLGKTAVRCRNTPGFIVNRLLIPYLSDACSPYRRASAPPRPSTPP